MPSAMPMIACKNIFQVLASAVVVLIAASATANSNFTAATGNTPKFTMHSKPQPMPALVFQDGEGRMIELKNFRGKIVVLNLWATWCAPCRKEMPTLDRLQAQLGGINFEVVALSVDFSGAQVVRNFYRDFGIKHLRLYIDPSSRVLDQVKVLGLPATLLIDRNGRELGRLVGAAEWDSPEMLRLFRGLIGKEPEDRRVDATRSMSAALAD